MTSRGLGLITMMLGLALFVSSCQSSQTAASNRGGTLRIGAWEPNCADPLLQCSFNPWGGAYPSMTLQTLPHVFAVHDGTYVPSALLADAPAMSQGSPQTVSYHINPKAVWSDG